MKITLYNQKGEEKGEVTLNPKIFEIPVNEGLIHQTMVIQQGNQRKPIAHTKIRKEVRGGGRKPYRQKGTGRARQGSIRAPHFRGGGVVFGPRKDRNFKRKIPQKQKRKAIFCALSLKAQEKKILALDKYETPEIKTKIFREMLDKLPIDRNVLMIIPEKNELIQKSSRNLPQIKILLINNLNVVDLINYHQILFLEPALKKLEELFFKPTLYPYPKSS